MTDTAYLGNKRAGPRPRRAAADVFGVLGHGGILSRKSQIGILWGMPSDPTVPFDAGSAAIVARAQRRSEDGLDDARAAFDELYRAHGRPLTAWLSARVPASDLDDLHHEIWARIWEKLPTAFAGGHFRAWLFAVARNQVVDAARRRHSRARVGLVMDEAETAVDAEACDPVGEEPWQVLAAEERGRRLAGCLERLDAGRRRVMVGRIAGEEYGDISDGLGITVTQAQSWLFVAKRLLRECLGEDA